MAEQSSLKATVYGHVQGVFFRDFITRHAQELGLTGYARNLRSGEVEVYAEGERARLEQLVERLKRGPPGARVDRVVTEYSATTGRYSDFKVIR